MTRLEALEAVGGAARQVFAQGEGCTVSGCGGCMWCRLERALRALDEAPCCDAPAEEEPCP